MAAHTLQGAHVSLAQHSKKSAEHYSPLEYIEAARAVMGGIDLDPATTASVNRQRVKATRFFTKVDDGLIGGWALPDVTGQLTPSRVWLNPPGGIINHKSAAAVWWDKLAYEWHVGRVSQALFLGFSIEILQTAQARGMCIRWPGSFPFCVPEARIDFDQEQEDGTFRKGGAPSHANIIVYLPPKDRPGFPEIGRFAEEFGRFGAVRL